MADQVNPTGSLAPGIPLTYATVPRPQPAQDKPKTAKPTQPSTPPSREEAGKESSAQALEVATRELKKFLQQSPSDLMFQVDESSGRTYFKIVDSKTKEVIRQVPSEEMLAMARKLRELAAPENLSGVLVDKEG